MNRPMTRSRVALRFSRLPSNPDRIAAALDILAPDERARAGRFRREQDRCEYVLARATLRRLLGRDLACHPAGVVFGCGPAGKPVLLHPAVDTHFSVAHCRGGLAIAWCAGREVGVDLEWMDPARVDLGVARRVFSASRVRRLELASSPERTRLFYRFWTRLEAAAKASGAGVVRFRARPDRITVRSFTPAPGFIGAVAVTSG